MRVAFWLMVAATLGVYAAMVFWSIPRITADAGGALPFDMRPGGYSFGEAREFLSALSADGAVFYRNVQLRLDLLYPALLALATGWVMLRLAPPWRFRRALLLAPLPAMVFDYLENAAIARMLTAEADGLTPDLVARASAFSQLKALTSALSLGLLAVLAAFALWRRWHRRRA